MGRGAAATENVSSLRSAEARTLRGRLLRESVIEAIYALKLSYVGNLDEAGLYFEENDGSGLCEFLVTLEGEKLFVSTPFAGTVETFGRFFSDEEDLDVIESDGKALLRIALGDVQVESQKTVEQLCYGQYRLRSALRFAATRR
jgi:hypothetical protein